jgi:hypothetical protein
MPVPKRPNIERFLDKIEFTESCWPWKAAMLQNGYGTFGTASDVPGRLRTVYAHRYSYELFVGPIPDGLVIDHLCRNRLCVNPDHLRAVTRWTNNMENTVNPIALNPDKAHCPQGHPYNEANTHITKKGHRKCRACNRDRNLAAYHAKRARGRE